MDQLDKDRELLFGAGAATSAKPYDGIEADRALLFGASKPAPSVVGATRTGNPLTNFAQGVNQGVIGTAGLPVDTVLNVVDLLKSGYGYAKGKLGGTDLPELTNRQSIPGSSEWIANQVRKISPMIADPADPAGPAAAIGRGVGGTLPFAGASQGPQLAQSLVAPTARSIARNLSMGGVSGLGAQIGANAGGPEGAILGGMLPGLGAQSLGPMIMRGAIRGSSGETTAKNIADLKDAGITTPSVGMTTQNSKMQWLENVLAKLPVSGGIIRDNALGVQSQLTNKLNATRDQTSPTYGTFQAGQAIDKGVGDYNKRAQGIASQLYDRIQIPWYKQYQTPETLSRVNDMTRPIVGAPAITEFLGRNSGLPARVKGAFNADEAGTSGIPYEAIKQSRSLIGEMIPQQIWDRTPGVQQSRSIYGALSGDLKNAAATAQQLPRFERANNFYNGLMGRMDEITPFSDKSSPEAGYRGLMSAAKGQGSQAETLLKTLPAAQRRIVAATVLDEIGKAKPGQQNAEGNRFSSETFLTNWSTVDPKAKTALFSGYDDAPKIRGNLDKIANAASLLRDQGRILSNPSGSGAAVMNASGPIAAASAVTGAAVTGNLWAIAPVATGGAGLYLGAKSLVNPKFSDWLARSTEISAQQQKQHLQRLATIINQTPSGETKDEMTRYYQSLQQ